MRQDPKSSSVPMNASFFKFQRNYLLVYLIVSCADWLQGPYMFVVYQTYGFPVGDIGKLFITGFISAMIFGPVVGALADKFGRKKMCLGFCVFYGAACILAHIPVFPVLILGRILSGVATAILFSCFEAWMIHQHFHRGFHADLLESTFDLATTGNGIIAIFAGFLASILVARYGPLSPLKASLVCLVLAFLVISPTWSENYGNSQIEILESLQQSVHVLRKDPRVLILGFAQSLFESGMYIFVFMWTPALQSTTPFEVLNGWVFACFMISITIGSAVFSYSSQSSKIEEIGFWNYISSIFFLAVPAFSTNHVARLLAFCAFEGNVGIHFPVTGILRGKVIPEGQRSTLMTFFRVPLNFIVACVLLSIDNLAESSVFIICSITAGVSAALLFSMSKLDSKYVSVPRQVDDEDEQELQIKAEQ